MSDSTLLQLYQTLLIPHIAYIQLGCVALVFYEYLLTFRREYRVIWSRRLTIPSLLFLLNRYALFLLAIAILMAEYTPLDVSLSQPRCRVLDRFQRAATMPISVLNTVFFALRIHAINNHKWFWTTLLLFLGSLDVPFNIVGITKVYYVSNHGLPFLGCLGDENWPWERCLNDMATGASIALEANNYVGAILEIGIIWYRTGAVYAARRLDLQPSLSYYLLRDGTTYFLCVVCGIIHVSVADA
ncbi:hypothetical protein C8Q80DRAFT_1189254 [Daedaleopsis nitida]|nr:hypothetical protein C8Q80DRAFT_1189254 [Daedaleopsis nitida]